jgi:outer membrane lipoprotein-sorting protein
MFDLVSFRNVTPKTPQIASLNGPISQPARLTFYALLRYNTVMRSLFVLLVLCFAIGLFLGCRERAVPPTEKPTATPEKNAEQPQDAAYILDQMVTAYKVAVSYSDHAAVQILGKMSQTGTEPVAWNCTIAFQKPNKLRLEINEGIFVSDGEDCFAQIQSLPDQVLHFPAPPYWHLDALFQDASLDAAMEFGFPRTVLRFPPQLILLLTNNPLNTLCPTGAAVEWIEQQDINKVPCDVLQISHSDGNRVLWISRESRALLRFDYQPVGLPVPDGFESIEAIRIELTDAQFDWNFTPEAFQMVQPNEATQVTAFHSGTPTLLTNEEHRRQLKSMADSDCYRQINTPFEVPVSSEPVQPPQIIPPKTFTLTQVWSQPLIGTGTMTVLDGAAPQLLVPCEGNLLAVLSLQGKLLRKFKPEGLGDNEVITAIRANLNTSDKPYFGMITLSGTAAYVFDEEFKPVMTYKPKADENKQAKITDIQFFRHKSENLLLIGMEQEIVTEIPAQEDAVPTGLMQAVDMTCKNRLKWHSAGVPYQIAPAIIEDCLVTLTLNNIDAHGSIAIWDDFGNLAEGVNVQAGWQVLWFGVKEETIYTLLNSEDNAVRFAGFDQHGKEQWGRVLPPEKYEVDPIYLPLKKRWLVPSSSGKIFVFDLFGNLVDTFSFGNVPTGMFCTADENQLLFVADGETVSAWTIEKLNSAP